MSKASSNLEETYGILLNLENYIYKDNSHLNEIVEDVMKKNNLSIFKNIRIENENYNSLIAKSNYLTDNYCDKNKIIDDFIKLDINIINENETKNIIQEINKTFMQYQIEHNKFRKSKSVSDKSKSILLLNQSVIFILI